MVRLNGIKLGKERYFSSVVGDLIRFLLYFEKCLVRSIIVIICLFIGTSGNDSDGTYHHAHILSSLKIENSL